MFYVFSYSKNNNFLRYFWNDVSKSRKKVTNISKQQAYETEKFGWIMKLTLFHKRMKFAKNNVYRNFGLKIPAGYGDYL